MSHIHFVLQRLQSTFDYQQTMLSAIMGPHDAKSCQEMLVKRIKRVQDVIKKMLLDTHGPTHTFVQMIQNTLKTMLSTVGNTENLGNNNACIMTYAGINADLTKRVRRFTENYTDLHTVMRDTNGNDELLINFKTTNFMSEEFQTKISEIKTMLHNGSLTRVGFDTANSLFDLSCLKTDTANLYLCQYWRNMLLHPKSTEFDTEPIRSNAHIQETIAYICSQKDGTFDIERDCQHTEGTDRDTAYIVMRYNLNTQYKYLYEKDKWPDLERQRQLWIAHMSTPDATDSASIRNQETVKLMRSLDSVQTIQALIGAGVPVATMHHDLMTTLGEQLEYCVMSAKSLGLCNQSGQIEDTPTITTSTLLISLFTLISV